jgi:hypothetical protein
MHKFMVTVPKAVTNAIHGPPLIADANEVASIRLPSLFPCLVRRGALVAGFSRVAKRTLDPRQNRTAVTNTTMRLTQR